MTFTRLILIPLVAMVITSTANATTKVGISGVQSFTNHKRLSSPTGFGILVQKSLSRSIALRFDLSRSEDKQEFDEVMYRNLPPRGDVDRVEDRFRSYSTMYCGEISFQFRLLEWSRMQMHFGLGPGVVVLDGNITGTTTVFQRGGSPAEKFCFAFWLDLEYTNDHLFPFTSALTVRQRFAHQQFDFAYDSYSPFRDAIRATELVLSVAAAVE